MRLACPQCGSVSFYAIEQVTVKHYAEIFKDDEGIAINQEANAITVQDALGTILGYQCVNEDDCGFFVAGHELGDKLVDSRTVDA
jgi:hypothetical protein